MIRACMFAALFVLVASAPASAADRGTILGVEGRTAGGAKGEPALITITSEGGFRWSKTERFTIHMVAGKPSLGVERVPYEGQTQGPLEKPLTAGEHAEVLRVLEANAALALKDDLSLKGQATDLPTYDVTVSLGGKTNRFRVFGPQLLKRDARYMAITDAVEALADKYSPAPQL